MLEETLKSTGRRDLEVFNKRHFALMLLLTPLNRSVSMIVAY